MAEEWDIFAQAEPTELRQNAEKQLDQMIGYFDTTQTNIIPLIQCCSNIWTNINRNPTLRKKINEQIEIQAKASSAVLSKDEVNVEDTRRRYDPYQWTKNIPPELKNDKYTYFRDKAKSLLGLIKAIQ